MANDFDATHSAKIEGGEMSGRPVSGLWCPSGAKVGGMENVCHAPELFPFCSHFLGSMGTERASKVLWRIEIVGVLRQIVCSSHGGLGRVKFFWHFFGPFWYAYENS